MTIPQALDLAVQRHQAGDLAAAEALYRQILAAQPNHADALHLLGEIAYQMGQNETAAQLIGRAISIRPFEARYLVTLGRPLKAQGQFDAAIAAYRKAILIDPTLAEAHNNLGNALRERGQLAEAVAECRRALQLKPDYPEAHHNLGAALAAQGQLDQAVAAYRRALELRPNIPTTYNNLGNALRERGQFDEAVAAFLRALELKPDYAEAHNNLGNALRDRGELDPAIAAYRRALELKPDFADAHSNLGNARRDQGLLEEALAAYRHALELNPEQVGVQSNLIYTLHFHPGHDARSIAEERRRWNRRFAEPLKRFIAPHANDRAPDRRLRVGYVSPDFRNHVVGRNLLPLFARHDHRNFEIFCYSGVAQADQLTEAFRRRADHWRSTVGLDDEALADLIRRDGVDILVDLTQHMAENRLPMFARKPAPVQVSFAGYPDSAGLEAIEYRISDRYLEAGSADQENGRTEQIRFIDSFWCYDPCGVEVEVNPLPALENETVTFGSLGNFGKVNERVLKLWARALGTAPDSRLLIWSLAGNHRERTLEVLRSEGVEARRVEFVGFRPRREYLELYHRLDIVLDTFPYNGHTTSLDALWMGVPVVSLVGNPPVSRAGLSQLTNLGLPELAAGSESEYVNIAGGLARNLPRLAELRGTLRDRMANSVLMDAPRFARQVEQAYREMWQAWSAGGKAK